MKETKTNKMTFDDYVKLVTGRPKHKTGKPRSVLARPIDRVTVYTFPDGHIECRNWGIKKAVLSMAKSLHLSQAHTLDVIYSDGQAVRITHQGGMGWRIKF